MVGGKSGEVVKENGLRKSRGENEEKERIGKMVSPWKIMWAWWSPRWVVGMGLYILHGTMLVASSSWARLAWELLAVGAAVLGRSFALVQDEGVVGGTRRPGGLPVGQVRRAALLGEV